MFKEFPFPIKGHVGTIPYNPVYKPPCRVRSGEVALNRPAHSPMKVPLMDLGPSKLHL